MQLDAALLENVFDKYSESSIATQISNKSYLSLIAAYADIFQCDYNLKVSTVSFGFKESSGEIILKTILCACLRSHEQNNHIAHNNKQHDLPIIEIEFNITKAEVHTLPINDYLYSLTNKQSWLYIALANRIKSNNSIKLSTSVNHSLLNSQLNGNKLCEAIKTDLNSNQSLLKHLVCLSTHKQDKTIEELMQLVQTGGAMPSESTAQSTLTPFQLFVKNSNDAFDVKVIKAELLYDTDEKLDFITSEEPVGIILTVGLAMPMSNLTNLTTFLKDIKNKSMAGSTIPVKLIQNKGMAMAKPLQNVISCAHAYADDVMQFIIETVNQAATNSSENTAKATIESLPQEKQNESTSNAVVKAQAQLIIRPSNKTKLLEILNDPTLFKSSLSLEMNQQHGFSLTNKDSYSKWTFGFLNSNESTSMTNDNQKLNQNTDLILLSVLDELLDCCLEFHNETFMQRTQNFVISLVNELLKQPEFKENHTLNSFCSGHKLKNLDLQNKEIIFKFYDYLSQFVGLNPKIINYFFKSFDRLSWVLKFKNHNELCLDLQNRNFESQAQLTIHLTNAIDSNSIHKSAIGNVYSATEPDESTYSTYAGSTAAVLSILLSSSVVGDESTAKQFYLSSLKINENVSSNLILEAQFVGNERFFNEKMNGFDMTLYEFIHSNAFTFVYA